MIYLALEEKRSEVRKHFKEMGATGAEDIYVYAASAPADGLEQIRQAADQLKPVLIIIDPLFRFTRVRDGNDYASVTQALEPLLALARETRAHVLCVHHAGKSPREGGDSILGSTAIFAAVDTALIMRRTDRYRTIMSQQRYGEDFEETVLRFDKSTGTTTLGQSREREDVANMKQSLRKFLDAREEPTAESDIKGSVEGNNSLKQTALRELVADSVVIRTGKGTRGKPYLYSLTNLSYRRKSESENPEVPANQCGSKDYSHFNTSPLGDGLEASE